MCGIIGIFGSNDSARQAYQGLLTLQHRGQDGAGILSYDFDSKEFKLHKSQGLVGEAIKDENLAGLTGTMSIGHTRYSTIGKGNVYDLQPMLVSFPFGLGMVHNGNLVNYFDLKEQLRSEDHCQMISGNDLEVMQNIFRLRLQKTIQGRDLNELTIEDLTPSATEVIERAEGGYSVIGELAGQGLFAFRDPEGLRPLVLGKKETTEGTSYVLASESVALEYLDYNFERDVYPGELIFINKEGKFFSKQITQREKKPCMFEWIYFSSPESSIEGKSVYRARLNLGIKLAEKVQPLIDAGEINPDVVIPVPETSRIAAISCAETLKIPYRETLIKNRYIQRSFILNSQDERERAVKLKLSPVTGELVGKKVLIVDDSIVRGTTSSNIVQMVKKAGAKEVIFATTCAPIRYPCFFGIDFPQSKDLVAHGKSEEQIADYLLADKVVYLSEEAIGQAIGLSSTCMACLNGKYPVDISKAQQFNERRELRDKRN